MAASGELREILHALGTGGTAAMAEGVQSWLAARGANAVSDGDSVWPEDILGLAEVAAMLGVSKQLIGHWIARDAHSFPRPVATLAATRIWDRAKVEVWAAGHAELLRRRRRDAL